MMNNYGDVNRTHNGPEPPSSQAPPMPPYPSQPTPNVSGPPLHSPMPVMPPRNYSTPAQLDEYFNNCIYQSKIFPGQRNLSHCYKRNIQHEYPTDERPYICYKTCCQPYPSPYSMNATATPSPIQFPPFSHLNQQCSLPENSLPDRMIHGQSSTQQCQQMDLRYLQSHSASNPMFSQRVPNPVSSREPPMVPGSHYSTSNYLHHPFYNSRPNFPISPDYFERMPNKTRSSKGNTSKHQTSVIKNSNDFSYPSEASQKSQNNMPMTPVNYVYKKQHISETFRSSYLPSCSQSSCPPTNQYSSIVTPHPPRTPVIESNPYPPFNSFDPASSAAPVNSSPKPPQTDEILKKEGSSKPPLNIDVRQFLATWDDDDDEPAQTSSALEVHSTVGSVMNKSSQSNVDTSFNDVRDNVATVNPTRSEYAVSSAGEDSSVLFKILKPAPEKSGLNDDLYPGNMEHYTYNQPQLSTVDSPVGTHRSASPGQQKPYSKPASNVSGLQYQSEALASYYRNKSKCNKSDFNFERISENISPADSRHDSPCHYPVPLDQNPVKTHVSGDQDGSSKMTYLNLDHNVGRSSKPYPPVNHGSKAASKTRPSTPAPIYDFRDPEAYIKSTVINKADYVRKNKADTESVFKRAPNSRDSKRVGRTSTKERSISIVPPNIQYSDKVPKSTNVVSYNDSLPQFHHSQVPYNKSTLMPYCMSGNVNNQLTNPNYDYSVMGVLNNSHSYVKYDSNPPKYPSEEQKYDNTCSVNINLSITSDKSPQVFLNSVSAPASNHVSCSKPMDSSVLLHKGNNQMEYFKGNIAPHQKPKTSSDMLKTKNVAEDDKCINENSFSSSPVTTCDQGNKNSSFPSRTSDTFHIQSLINDQKSNSLVAISNFGVDTSYSRSTNYMTSSSNSEVSHVKRPNSCVGWSKSTSSPKLDETSQHEPKSSLNQIYAPIERPSSCPTNPTPFHYGGMDAFNQVSLFNTSSSSKICEKNLGSESSSSFFTGEIRCSNFESDPSKVNQVETEHSGDPAMGNRKNDAYNQVSLFNPSDSKNCEENLGTEALSSFHTGEIRSANFGCDPAKVNQVETDLRVDPVTSSREDVGSDPNEAKVSKVSQSQYCGPSHRNSQSPKNSFDKLLSPRASVRISPDSSIVKSDTVDFNSNSIDSEKKINSCNLVDQTSFPVKTCSENQEVSPEDEQHSTAVIDHTVNENLANNVYNDDPSSSQSNSVITSTYTHNLDINTDLGKAAAKMCNDPPRREESSTGKSTKTIPRKSNPIKKRRSVDHSATKIHDNSSEEQFFRNSNGDEIDSIISETCDSFKNSDNDLLSSPIQFPVEACSERKEQSVMDDRISPLSFLNFSASRDSVHDKSDQPLDSSSLTLKDATATQNDEFELSKYCKKAKIVSGMADLLNSDSSDCDDVRDNNKGDSLKSPGTDSKMRSVTSDYSNFDLFNESASFYPHVPCPDTPSQKKMNCSSFPKKTTAPSQSSYTYTGTTTTMNDCFGLSGQASENSQGVGRGAKNDELALTKNDNHTDFELLVQNEMNKFNFESDILNINSLDEVESETSQFFSEQSLVHSTEKLLQSSVMSTNEIVSHPKWNQTKESAKKNTDSQPLRVCKISALTQSSSQNKKLLASLKKIKKPGKVHKSRNFEINRINPTNGISLFFTDSDEKTETSSENEDVTNFTNVPEIETATPTADINDFISSCQSPDSVIVKTKSSNAESGFQRLADHDDAAFNDSNVKSELPTTSPDYSKILPDQNKIVGSSHSESQLSSVCNENSTKLSDEFFSAPPLQSECSSKTSLSLRKIRKKKRKSPKPDVPKNSSPFESESSYIPAIVTNDGDVYPAPSLPSHEQSENRSNLDFLQDQYSERMVLDTPHQITQEEAPKRASTDSKLAHSMKHFEINLSSSSDESNSHLGQQDHLSSVNHYEEGCSKLHQISLTKDDQSETVEHVSQPLSKSPVTISSEILRESFYHKGNLLIKESANNKKSSMTRDLKDSFSLNEDEEFLKLLSPEFSDNIEGDMEINQKKIVESPTKLSDTNEPFIFHKDKSFGNSEEFISPAQNKSGTDVNAYFDSNNPGHDERLERISFNSSPDPVPQSVYEAFGTDTTKNNANPVMNDSICENSGNLIPSNQQELQDSLSDENLDQEMENCLKEVVSIRTKINNPPENLVDRRESSKETESVMYDAEVQGNSEGSHHESRSNYFTSIKLTTSPKIPIEAISSENNNSIVVACSEFNKNIAEEHDGGVCDALIDAAGDICKESTLSLKRNSSPKISAKDIVWCPKERVSEIPTEESYSEKLLNYNEENQVQRGSQLDSDCETNLNSSGDTNSFPIGASTEDFKFSVEKSAEEWKLQNSSPFQLPDSFPQSDPLMNNVSTSLNLMNTQSSNIIFESKGVKKKKKKKKKKSRRISTPPILMTNLNSIGGANSFPVDTNTEEVIFSAEKSSEEWKPEDPAPFLLSDSFSQSDPSSNDISSSLNLLTSQSSNMMDEPVVNPKKKKNKKKKKSSAFISTLPTFMTNLDSIGGTNSSPVDTKLEEEKFAPDKGTEKWKPEDSAPFLLSDSFSQSDPSSNNILPFNLLTSQSFNMGEPVVNPKERKNKKSSALTPLLPTFMTNLDSTCGTNSFPVDIKLEEDKLSPDEGVEKWKPEDSAPFLLSDSFTQSDPSSNNVSTSLNLSTSQSSNMIFESEGVKKKRKNKKKKKANNSFLMAVESFWQKDKSKSIINPPKSTSLVNPPSCHNENATQAPDDCDNHTVPLSSLAFSNQDKVKTEASFVFLERSELSGDEQDPSEQETRVETIFQGRNEKDVLNGSDSDQSCFISSRVNADCKDVVPICQSSFVSNVVSTDFEENIPAVNLAEEKERNSSKESVITPINIPVSVFEECQPKISANLNESNCSPVLSLTNQSESNLDGKTEKLSASIEVELNEDFCLEKDGKNENARNTNTSEFTIFNESPKSPREEVKSCYPVAENAVGEVFEEKQAEMEPISLAHEENIMSDEVVSDINCGEVRKCLNTESICSLSYETQRNSNRKAVTEDDVTEKTFTNSFSPETKSSLKDKNVGKLIDFEEKKEVEMSIKNPSLSESTKVSNSLNPSNSELVNKSRSKPEKAVKTDSNLFKRQSPLDNQEIETFCLNKGEEQNELSIPFNSLKPRKTSETSEKEFLSSSEMKDLDEGKERNLSVQKNMNAIDKKPEKVFKEASLNIVDSIKNISHTKSQSVVVSSMKRIENVCPSGTKTEIKSRKSSHKQRNNEPRREPTQKMLKSRREHKVSKHERETCNSRDKLKHGVKKHSSSKDFDPSDNEKPVFLYDKSDATFVRDKPAVETKKEKESKTFTATKCETELSVICTDPKVETSVAKLSKNSEKMRDRKDFSSKEHSKNQDQASAQSPALGKYGVPNVDQVDSSQKTDEPKKSKTDPSSTTTLNNPTENTSSNFDFIADFDGKQETMNFENFHILFEQTWEKIAKLTSKSKTKNNSNGKSQNKSISSDTRVEPQNADPTRVEPQNADPFLKPAPVDKRGQSVPKTTSGNDRTNMKIKINLSEKIGSVRSEETTPSNSTPTENKNDGTNSEVNDNLKMLQNVFGTNKTRYKLSNMMYPNNSPDHLMPKPNLKPSILPLPVDKSIYFAENYRIVDVSKIPLPSSDPQSAQNSEKSHVSGCIDDPNVVNLKLLPGVAKGFVTNNHEVSVNLNLLRSSSSNETDRSIPTELQIQELKTIPSCEDSATILKLKEKNIRYSNYYQKLMHKKLQGKSRSFHEREKSSDSYEVKKAFGLSTSRLPKQEEIGASECKKPPCISHYVTPEKSKQDEPSALFHESKKVPCPSRLLGDFEKKASTVNSVDKNFSSLSKFKPPEQKEASNTVHEVVNGLPFSEIKTSQVDLKEIKSPCNDSSKISPSSMLVKSENKAIPSKAPNGDSKKISLTSKSKIHKSERKRAKTSHNEHRQAPLPSKLETFNSEGDSSRSFDQSELLSPSLELKSCEFTKRKSEFPHNEHERVSPPSKSSCTQFEFVFPSSENEQSESKRKIIKSGVASPCPKTKKSESEERKMEVPFGELETVSPSSNFKTSDSVGGASKSNLRNSKVLTTKKSESERRLDEAEPVSSSSKSKPSNSNGDASKCTASNSEVTSASSKTKKSELERRLDKPETVLSPLKLKSSNSNVHTSKATADNSEVASSSSKTKKSESGRRKAELPLDQVEKVSSSLKLKTLHSDRDARRKSEIIPLTSKANAPELGRRKTKAFHDEFKRVPLPSKLKVSDYDGDASKSTQKKSEAVSPSIKTEGSDTGNFKRNIPQFELERASLPSNSEASEFDGDALTSISNESNIALPSPKTKESELQSKKSMVSHVKREGVSLPSKLKASGSVGDTSKFIGNKSKVALPSLKLKESEVEQKTGMVSPTDHEKVSSPSKLKASDSVGNTLKSIGTDLNVVLSCSKTRKSKEEQKKSVVPHTDDEEVSLPSKLKASDSVGETLKSIGNELKVALSSLKTKEAVVELEKGKVSHTNLGNVSLPSKLGDTLKSIENDLNVFVPSLEAKESKEEPKKSMVSHTDHKEVSLPLKLKAPDSVGDMLKSVRNDLKVALPSSKTKESELKRKKGAVAHAAHEGILLPSKLKTSDSIIDTSKCAQNEVDAMSSSFSTTPNECNKKKAKSAILERRRAPSPSNVKLSRQEENTTNFSTNESRVKSPSQKQLTHDSKKEKSENDEQRNSISSQLDSKASKRGRSELTTVYSEKISPISKSRKVEMKSKKSTSFDNQSLNVSSSSKSLTCAAHVEKLNVNCSESKKASTSHNVVANVGSLSSSVQSAKVSSLSNIELINHETKEPKIPSLKSSKTFHIKSKTLDQIEKTPSKTCTNLKGISALANHKKSQNEEMNSSCTASDPKRKSSPVSGTLNSEGSSFHISTESRILSSLSSSNLPELDTDKQTSPFAKDKSRLSPSKSAALESTSLIRPKKTKNLANQEEKTSRFSKDRLKGKNEDRRICENRLTFKPSEMSSEITDSIISKTEARFNYSLPLEMRDQINHGEITDRIISHETANLSISQALEVSGEVIDNFTSKKATSLNDLQPFKMSGEITDCIIFAKSSSLNISQSLEMWGTILKETGPEVPSTKVNHSPSGRYAKDIVISSKNESFNRNLEGILSQSSPQNDKSSVAVSSIESSVSKSTGDENRETICGNLMTATAVDTSTSPDVNVNIPAFPRTCISSADSLPIDSSLTDENLLPKTVTAALMEKIYKDDVPAVGSEERIIFSEKVAFMSNKRLKKEETFTDTAPEIKSSTRETPKSVESGKVQVFAAEDQRDPTTFCSRGDNIKQSVSNGRHILLTNQISLNEILPENIFTHSHQVFPEKVCETLINALIADIESKLGDPPEEITSSITLHRDEVTSSKEDAPNDQTSNRHGDFQTEVTSLDVGVFDLHSVNIETGVIPSKLQESSKSKSDRRRSTSLKDVSHSISPKLANLHMEGALSNLDEHRSVRRKRKVDHDATDPAIIECARKESAFSESKSSHKKQRKHSSSEKTSARKDRLSSKRRQTDLIEEHFHVKSSPVSETKVNSNLLGSNFLDGPSLNLDSTLDSCNPLKINKGRREMCLSKEPFNITANHHGARRLLFSNSQTESPNTLVNDCSDKRPGRELSDNQFSAKTKKKKPNKKCRSVHHLATRVKNKNKATSKASKSVSHLHSKSSDSESSTSPTYLKGFELDGSNSFVKCFSFLKDNMRYISDPSSCSFINSENEIDVQSDVREEVTNTRLKGEVHLLAAQEDELRSENLETELCDSELNYLNNYSTDDAFDLGNGDQSLPDFNPELNVVDPEADSDIIEEQEPNCSQSSGTNDLKVRLPWNRIFNLKKRKKKNVQTSKGIELGPAKIEVRLNSNENSGSWKVIKNRTLSVSSDENCSLSSPIGIKVNRLVLQRHPVVNDLKSKANSKIPDVEPSLHQSNASAGEKPVIIPNVVIKKNGTKCYKSYITFSNKPQPVVKLMRDKFLDHLALQWKAHSLAMKIKSDIESTSSTQCHTSEKQERQSKNSKHISCISESVSLSSFASANQVKVSENNLEVSHKNQKVSKGTREMQPTVGEESQPESMEIETSIVSRRKSVYRKRNNDSDRKKNSDTHRKNSDGTDKRKIRDTDSTKDSHTSNKNNSLTNSKKNRHTNGKKNSHTSSEKSCETKTRKKSATAPEKNDSISNKNSSPTLEKIENSIQISERERPIFDNCTKSSDLNSFNTLEMQVCKDWCESSVKVLAEPIIAEGSCRQQTSQDETATSETENLTNQTSEKGKTHTLPDEKLICVKKTDQSPLPNPSKSPNLLSISASSTRRIKRSASLDSEEKRLYKRCRRDCGICSNPALRMDQNSNLMEEKFHCTKCCLEFKSEEEEEIHFSTFHKDWTKTWNCLLCHRTFRSQTLFDHHLNGRTHKLIETVQRETIHSLFSHFTGKDCPNLKPVSSDSTSVPKPTDPIIGIIECHPTPLQIALKGESVDPKITRS